MLLSFDFAAKELWECNVIIASLRLSRIIIIEKW